MIRILNIKALFLLFALINLSSLTAKKSYNKSPLVVNFKKGEEYLKNGRNAEALGCFQTALIHSPNNTSALIMAGYACYNLNLYASAIDYNIKAIDLEPISSAYNNLAMIYGIIGDDELCLEALNLVDDEESLNKLIALGAIAERQAKYKDALQYTHAAKNIEDKNIIPYYNLSIIHDDISNIDSALYYSNKVISLNPNSLLGYNSKLSILQKIGKPKQEYLPLCKKIISLCSKGDINDYKSLKIKGETYATLGDEKKKKTYLEKSLIILNHLIELYPNAYPIISDRAEVYAELGDTNAAISDFKRSLEINSVYKRTKDGLAKVLNK